MEIKNENDYKTLNDCEGIYNTDIENPFNSMSMSTLNEENDGSADQAP